VISGQLAAIGMYPFVEARAGFDALWVGVHARLPSTPAALDWDADLHASWRDPNLLVAQTCGWPLVTELAGAVRVVGAFEHTVPRAVGFRYRSVLVARRQAPLADFVGQRAAVNGRDSLSGWVSLIHAVHGSDSSWTGPVVLTGAHIASLRAVRDGDADIASIDSVTLAFARRDHPELLDGVVEVGEGPLVPSLPLITRADASDDEVNDLRLAFAGSVAEQPDAAASVFVRAFVPLDVAEYEPLLALGAHLPS
jgi:ABC-type phosphate/phosphonate transport system substrate-binding protein